MSFFSNLYRTPSNPAGVSAVVAAPVVGGTGVSNGFCYTGGCAYSSSGFDSTGLPSDVFTSNGGYSDPGSTDLGALTLANDVQDPFSTDPIFGSVPAGSDGSVDLGPVSPGPTDLGNPATNDTGGAGIGSSILNALGSGLGSLVRGLGSGLGFGSANQSGRTAMPALRSNAFPGRLASGYGGYAGNPISPRIPSPPAYPGQPFGMIAAPPGTPGRYGAQPYAGYGQPYFPPTCGTGAAFAPPSPLPYYAGGSSYSPGASIFPGAVYGGY